MPETLQKLCPDRDLQCYFERPSAIAALSQASASGFTVSGGWRQQFDWAVVEWNQHNVFEHPRFRPLPDGDLSGLCLAYEETRTNCIPLDSDLYPTVDWPYLRIWAQSNGTEELYHVRLRDYAVAAAGSYQCAQAELELQGTPTAGDYVGLSLLTEHHTYQIGAADTLESAVQAIVDSVNTFSQYVVASRVGATVRLDYVGPGQNLQNSTSGANGNRIGVYGFTAGLGGARWGPEWTRFTGGVSPTQWRITLDFSNLHDKDGRLVPMNNVRKMRWTYSADQQSEAFSRSEFEVRITNWTVTGTGRTYEVMGRSSTRIENVDEAPQYQGAWQTARGNFSGGSIHFTSMNGASVTCRYQASQDHRLYLGTRLSDNASVIHVDIDESAAATIDLRIPGEDSLARIPLGQIGQGEHVVQVTHSGAAGTFLYFDHIDIVVPTVVLPEPAPDPVLSLATDWDTDHSIALAPERTAWMIKSLGFHGRVNHYVGALWFYEMIRDGHIYSLATVDFEGVPQFSQITELQFGNLDNPQAGATVVTHVNTIGDTAQTIARAFELRINSGYTGIRAELSGTRLTIYARAMGAAGNRITLSVSPDAGSFRLVPSGPTMTGGIDGAWHTDLQAMPRINRAARDWTASFFQALKRYGLDSVAAVSMELQHGDPSPAAGIAQRYPNGDPVLLNTPALQTNFSPASIAFWRQVYLEMAQIMASCPLQPYLQFGEVQWWYFPSNGTGMPFYDAHTLTEFTARYGRPMAVIRSNDADPTSYPEESVFLPSLIANFTTEVLHFVRAMFPTCRFEVLYPTDVNDTSLNRVINYPASTWAPGTLDCLKTESFTYTLSRDLDRAQTTIRYPALKGFNSSQRSFLVGISDSTTAWLREVSLAKGYGVESIILFALDQFCLIGYPIPMPELSTRALRLA